MHTQPARLHVRTCTDETPSSHTLRSFSTSPHTRTQGTPPLSIGLLSPVTLPLVTSRAHKKRKKRPRHITNTSHVCIETIEAGTYLAHWTPLLLSPREIQARPPCRHFHLRPSSLHDLALSLARARPLSIYTCAPPRCTHVDDSPGAANGTCTLVTDVTK